MKNCFLLILFYFFFSFHVSSQLKSWVWDTQDLKVTKFRNGEGLFFAQTDEEWERASEEGLAAYYFYDGDISKGVLYNWYAVNDSRGLAPYEWRVPTKGDFDSLISANKEINSREEKSGFILDLKYNGYRTGDGFVSSIGQASYIWTSTKVQNDYMHSYSCMVLKADQNPMLIKASKDEGYCVRCIRNFDEEIIGLPPSEIIGKSTICEGEVITLKRAGGSLNENSKWVWYQDGVRIGEGESITVKPFLNKTTYSVRAESSNGEFSDFVEKEILMNSHFPASAITVSSTSPSFINHRGCVCENASVTFKVNGELSQGSTWKWIENGKVVSTQSTFSKVITTNSTIYVEAVNSICGNSGSIFKQIVVLKKTVIPTSINLEYSVTMNKTKLSFDTGFLGEDAEWKWYKVKKNGELKYIGKGTEIIINSFKTKKFVLQAEGGLCDSGPVKLDYQFYKRARPVGGEKKYANSRGIFHFGFDLGLDVHNLSSSFQVLDTIFNFRAKSYGFNIGLSFHPIINEFFTFGTRANLILDHGKIDNYSQFQQLLPQSTSTITKAGTFVLGKNSVGGELLIGVLSQGKLKLLIDYDLAKYTTSIIFGNSWTSTNFVKKETTGIGFRIGSYAKMDGKNTVQLDVLYSWSNFNETPLFDFSQSMFSNPSHLRSGFKMRMWVHNTFKLEAGLIYSLNPVTLKNDFNTKNAIVNFGLVWSFDRFY